MKKNVQTIVFYVPCFSGSDGCEQFAESKRGKSIIFTGYTSSCAAYIHVYIELFSFLVLIIIQYMCAYAV